MLGSILRYFPPFKGKQRLARFLFRNFINISSDVFVDGSLSCRYKLPNVKETVGFEIFINGIYEKANIDFIIRRLTRGKFLLDLGANIGAISLPVYKQRPDIRLICVEAAPWLFDYLTTNMKANNIQHVTLVNKAISDVSGKKVSFYSPEDKFGKGSMTPVFTSVGVEVETITLSDLVSNIRVEDIGFIKIDIEGFEYFAFKGGANLLTHAQAPDILLEFADWAEDLAPNIKAGAAQALLIEYGYYLYLFRDGRPQEKLDKPRAKGSSMMFATKSIL